MVGHWISALVVITLVIAGARDREADTGPGIDEVDSSALARGVLKRPKVARPVPHADAVVPPIVSVTLLATRIVGGADRARSRTPLDRALAIRAARPPPHAPRR